MRSRISEMDLLRTRAVRVALEVLIHLVADRITHRRKPPFRDVAYAEGVFDNSVPIAGGRFDFVLPDGTEIASSRDVRAILRLIALAKHYDLEDTFLALSAMRNTLHEPHAMWMMREGPVYGGPTITLTEWLGNNGIYFNAEPVAFAA